MLQERGSVTKTLAVPPAPRFRVRRMLMLAVVAITLVAVSAGNATAGYWSWGYNYMGSGVNQGVTGTWNYWANGYVDKTSGDWISHGWNTAASCYEFMWGDSTWFGHPSDTGNGCGGYLQRFAGWSSGSTSYLFFDSAT